MGQSAVVIMLAGGLRPAPLQQQLGVPPLRLPLGRQGTLLDWWVRTIQDTGCCREIRIVVNNDRHLDIVSQCDASRPKVRILSQSASWRGPGGIVRDASNDLRSDEVVLVVEASCLPPLSLEPILDALADGATAVVGAGADDEPAGVYGFARKAIQQIPDVGFYDLKEQLFPALCDLGDPARLVRLGGRVRRIRDRTTYFRAVRASLAGGADGDDGPRCSPQATISPEARILGCSIIEEGVVVERGAVVHDSVVMAGATIHRDAIVSRCVLGPGAKVLSAERRVDGILTATDGKDQGGAVKVTAPASVGAQRGKTQ